MGVTAKHRHNKKKCITSLFQTRLPLSLPPLLTKEKAICSRQMTFVLIICIGYYYSSYE